MNKHKNVQVINGCQYDVEVNQCSILNRAVVMVWQLDETLVAMLEIEHNTESVNVTYKLAAGEYSSSTYNYFELPKAAMYNELAQWIVNTHPNY